jgi:exopolyphosphatase/guanosine-5'-triphosphate,3'-diphosphate pyrophosphatase
MTRVAAVDCGTNSIRMLVADVDDVGLTEVDRRLEIVRLGQGVDRTGRLDPAALARTFAVGRDYAEEIERYGVERVRFVATSASRDAENRADFIAGIREIFGVDPEVISGDEEAQLSFDGATRSLRAAADLRDSLDDGNPVDPRHASGLRTFPRGRDGTGHSAPPYLVVDIGGGSTEFVLGDDTARAARSVDIGCVRLTERHLRADPPTADQIAAARNDIAKAIDQAAEEVPVAEARTLVGLAGSVTTVAGIALELDGYDPARIHHSLISAREIRRVSDELLLMTHRERAALPVMHPGRVDVIGAGALILAEVVDRAGTDFVVVSEHDILDGLAISCVFGGKAHGRAERGRHKPAAH